MAGKNGSDIFRLSQHPAVESLQILSSPQPQGSSEDKVPKKKIPPTFSGGGRDEPPSRPEFWGWEPREPLYPREVDPPKEARLSKLRSFTDLPCYLMFGLLVVWGVGKAFLTPYDPALGEPQITKTPATAFLVRGFRFSEYLPVGKQSPIEAYARAHNIRILIDPNAFHAFKCARFTPHARLAATRTAVNPLFEIIPYVKGNINSPTGVGNAYRLSSDKLGPIPLKVDKSEKQKPEVVSALDQPTFPKELADEYSIETTLIAQTLVGICEDILLGNKNLDGLKVGEKRVVKSSYREGALAVVGAEDDPPPKFPEYNSNSSYPEAVRALALTY